MCGAAGHPGGCWACGWGSSLLGVRVGELAPSVAPCGALLQLLRHAQRQRWAPPPRPAGLAATAASQHPTPPRPQLPQDKSVLVEELEDALLGLCEGRASAWEAARTAADAEEHAPAEAAVAAAAAVLSRGGAGAAGAAASAAAAAAAAAEERLLGRELPVELDEFGRDANTERRAELAER